MLHRLAALAAIATLVIAAGAVPVLADDDTPGDEPGVTAEAEEAEGEIGRGAEWIAGLLAHEFTGLGEIDTNDVIELHVAGLGFGEIFKLRAFAYALGEDVADLREDICGATADECEFGWGELRKGLTEEQLALFDELPKNLGQMISASKRGHGRPEHAASFSKESGRPDVPPGHAKRTDG